MIKKVVAITLLFSFQANSQFELSGQFRPRSEFRQGFQQLFDSDNAPAFFIDQRSRISSNFKNEKIEFHFVLQDYRTWGNTPQLNTSDYGLSIHESWAKLKINKLNNVKLGRQEIVFDNARIFGNVDWAQQGRKHDAILYNYKRKHEVNVGFAYNSNNPSLTNQTYTVSNNYKTLGFARTKLENEKMKLKKVIKKCLQNQIIVRERREKGMRKMNTLSIHTVLQKFIGKFKLTLHMKIYQVRSNWLSR